MSAEILFWLLVAYAVGFAHGGWWAERPKPAVDQDEQILRREP